MHTAIRAHTGLPVIRLLQEEIRRKKDNKSRAKGAFIIQYYAIITQRVNISVSIRHIFVTINTTLIVHFNYHNV